MRIGIIGRTRWLLESARALSRAGHKIAMVITSRAAPEYDVRESDFELLAAEMGAPFLQTQTINDPDTTAWIQSQGTLDIGVSINFTGVLGREVIESFKHGVLNAHAGDLPRYRGNACQAWAIVNGEDRIGLCIHKMVPDELDSGEIFARSFLEISENTRVGNVYEWLNEVIPPAMCDGVERCSVDGIALPIEVQSKDPADALRCYPRQPSDGRIRWDRARLDVLRLINASSEPYEGAFSFLDGAKVRLWRAYLPPPLEGKWLAIPGQVSAIDRTEGWVEVVCADGMLRITEMELAGERSAPTEFIRSIRRRLTDRPDGL